MPCTHPLASHYRATLTTLLSYGTTFAALSALAPRRCILDIDLQGVLQLRSKAAAQSPPLHPVYLFLSPPSVGELKSRLAGRGTESAESLGKRLAAAKKELQYAQVSVRACELASRACPGRVRRGSWITRSGWERDRADRQQDEGHDVVIINDDKTRAGEALEKVAMGYEGWEQVGDTLPQFRLEELDEA